MATTEAAKPAAVTTPHVPKPLPSRNPLPLSAAQEGQVRDMYYARVRGICAEEIRSELCFSTIQVGQRADGGG